MVQAFSLVVQATAHISEVKKMIEFTQGIPASSQILEGPEHQFMQDEGILKDYSIQNGSSIYFDYFYYSIWEPHDPYVIIHIRNSTGILHRLWFPVDSSRFTINLDQLKSMIQDVIGIPKNKHYLLFQKKRNVQEIKYDYDKYIGTIDLLFQNEIQIFVNYYPNKCIDFIVDKTTSIETIKNKICSKTNIPTEQQFLFFNKTQLQDGKTLQDYSCL